MKKSSVKRKSVKPKTDRQLFDDLFSMRLFVAMTDEIRNGSGMHEAARTLSNQYAGAKSRFSRIRDKLEKFYGVSLFDHRWDNSLTLPQDEMRSQLLESICRSIRTIVQVTRNMQSWKAHDISPRVIVGSLSSIFSYLLPAVLKVASQQKTVLKSDIEMFQGNRRQLEHMLKTRLLDFVIFASGEFETSDKSITEIELPYFRARQGLVFVYSRRNRRNTPFPNLNKILEDKNRSRVELIEAITKHKLISTKYGIADDKTAFQYIVADYIKKISLPEGRR